MAIKSIPAKDVKTLIATLENGLKKVDKTKDSHLIGGHSMALGQSQVIIETTIKMLRGDYPIIEL